MRLLGVLVLLGAAACSSSASNNNPAGVGIDAASAQLSWLTSSCSELGGTVLSTGACHVPCSASGGCPDTVEDVRCGNSSNQYCRPASCSSAADCGGAGWVCSYSFCHPSCSVSTAGSQSSECPPSFDCSRLMSSDALACYFLSGGGNTCGGCGKDSAGGCCGGIYCSGSCAGTPCC
jgi:hypothetical protein